MSWLLPALLLLERAAARRVQAQPAPPGEEASQDWEQDVPPVDPDIIDGRQRPGYTAPCPSGSNRTTKVPSARRRPAPFRPTNCPSPIAGD